MKSMRSCLVAYVKHLLERRLRHICKMKKLEIGAVIKYFLRQKFLPRKFIKSSLKPLGRSHLLIQFDISRYLLSHFEDDPGNFIERVVTSNETWVHHFDQKSKMQSKQ